MSIFFSRFFKMKFFFFLYAIFFLILHFIAFLPLIDGEMAFLFMKEYLLLYFISIPASFIPPILFFKKKLYGKVYFTEYGIYDKSRNVFLQYDRIEGYRQIKIHTPRSRNGLFILSVIMIRDYSHKHSITIEMTTRRYNKIMKSNIIPDCEFKKKLWEWYSGWFGSFDD